MDSFEKAAAAEIAALTPVPAPEGISEEEIAEKVQAGLSRKQAIEVIERQRAHDGATDSDPGAEKKPAKAAKKKRAAAQPKNTPQ